MNTAKRPEDIERGKQIKRLRVDVLHESKATFSKRFPVDYHTISRWEAGEYAPAPVYDRILKEIEVQIKPPQSKAPVKLEVKPKVVAEAERKPYTKEAQLKVKTK